MILRRVLVRRLARRPKHGATVLKAAQVRRDLKSKISKAKQRLGFAFQRGQIVAFGKPASAPFVPAPGNAPSIKILPDDLIGDLELSGLLCPPGQNWLIVKDRRTGRFIRAWSDVALRPRGVSATKENAHTKLVTALLKLADQGVDILTTHRGELHQRTLSVAAIKDGHWGASFPTFERALAEAIRSLPGAPAISDPIISHQ
jgi:hypothetical protein